MSEGAKAAAFFLTLYFFSLTAAWYGAQIIVLNWMSAKVRERKLREGKTQARLDLETRLTWCCFVANHAVKLPGRFFQGQAKQARDFLAPWTLGRVLGEDWLVVIDCHPRRPLSDELYYRLYDRFTLYEQWEG